MPGWRSDVLTGWEAVNIAVTTARAEVLAAAPDPAIGAEADAYVTRVLATCLNDAFLGHLLTESGLTRALPTRGGPNPDYRMAHAAIDPARRYCLEERLNDSEAYREAMNGNASVRKSNAVLLYVLGPSVEAKLRHESSQLPWPPP